MTTDAALAKRREEQELNEIAQISGGGSGKEAGELATGYKVSSPLLVAFQQASQSEHYREQQQKFVDAKIRKDERQEVAKEKKHERDREEAWLEAMSPEYRRAYGDLMDSVANADQSYDRMRHELTDQRQRLTEESQDIDDCALRLSDGKRTYVDRHGRFVDKDGHQLTETEKHKAILLWLERGKPPVANQEAYASNQAALSTNDRDKQLVNEGQHQADEIGADAKAHSFEKLEELKTHRETVKTTLTTTEAAIEAHKQAIQYTPATRTVNAGMLDGLDDTSPSTLANHGSFAKQFSDGISGPPAAQSFNVAASDQPSPVREKTDKPQPTASPAPQLK